MLCVIVPAPHTKGTVMNKEEMLNGTSILLQEAQILKNIGILRKFAPGSMRMLLSLSKYAMTTADLAADISRIVTGVEKITLIDAIADIEFYKKTRITPTGRQYQASLINWGRVNWRPFDPGHNKSVVQIWRKVLEASAKLAENNK
jgi:hypothetical protein